MNNVIKNELTASTKTIEQTPTKLQEVTMIFRQLNDKGQNAAIAMLKGLAMNEIYRINKSGA